MDGVSRNGLRSGPTGSDRWAASGEGGESPRTIAVPPAKSSHDECVSRLAALATAIESEIIPRLLMAHRSPPPAPSGNAPAAWLPPLGGIPEFTRLVLGADIDAASAFVARVRAQGVSLEALCSDLLGPTARHLGALWESDDRDIAEVTLGLMRLHRVLREFEAEIGPETSYGWKGMRALLVPAPGEQHRLGIAMVVEFFRRAGWDVCGNPPATLEQLRDLVREGWFDVVGFSISSRCLVSMLQDSVRTVREASRNREVLVMVGGLPFAKDPDLCTLVGADASVVDGMAAPARAEGMVSLQRSGRGYR